MQIKIDWLIDIKARLVYTEKIPVTYEMFHDVSLESAALLVFTSDDYYKTLRH